MIFCLSIFFSISKQRHHNLEYLWIKHKFPVIMNNYSPKWRWLVVDIYRAAKWRGKYSTLSTDTEMTRCFSNILKKCIICTTKFNLDDFFTSNRRKLGRHFLPSCSKVNSAGYSEFDIFIMYGLRKSLKSESKILRTFALIVSEHPTAHANLRASSCMRARAK